MGEFVRFQRQETVNPALVREVIRALRNAHTERCGAVTSARYPAKTRWASSAASMAGFATARARLGRVIRTKRAARTNRRIEVKGQLFLEAGVGGFSVQYTAAYDVPISKRYHSAWSATALANSPAAGTCQHVTTPHVVPPHKVLSDDVLSEQHRHGIVDMSGRNVSVRVHALQSFNKSLFECVDHQVFHMIQPGRPLQGLVKGLVTACRLQRA
jgi:hypothetical protein